MSRQDGLIARVRDMVVRIGAHNHPPGSDLYCLNLTSYIGDRGALIVEHVDALETRIAALEKALADIDKATHAAGYDSTRLAAVRSITSRALLPAAGKGEEGR